MELDIDDEDSVSSRLDVHRTEKPVDIAVVHLPHISNFTDFTALDQHPALGVRYVKSLRQLGNPDLVILPGTKNTMDDLLWLRQGGLESAVKKLAVLGTPIIGICGGYQMLGRHLADPAGVEQGGTLEGMGLLPITTVFNRQKKRTRVSGKVSMLDGPFACLSGAEFEGYEIHMGKSEPLSTVTTFSELHTGRPAEGKKQDGAAMGNILGNYVHGMFDSGEIAQRLADSLLEKKGLYVDEIDAFDYEAHKQKQFDLLADTIRHALDMPAIYKMMGMAK